MTFYQLLIQSLNGEAWLYVVYHMQGVPMSTIMKLKFCDFTYERPGAQRG